MATKTRAQTAKRKASGAQSKARTSISASAASANSTSAQKVIGRNLINMVVVMAGSGTVLLGLLAAKHFQIAHF
jgi:hypothetical protein